MMANFIQPDEETINSLRNEAAEYDRWAVFRNSDFGKHFITFLDNAIAETIEDEDKFPIYEKEIHHTLYNLAAVRSKRQTLRAIKKRIMEAEVKRNEIINDISKYNR